MISAISVIPDIEKTVTVDFKRPGELIYLVGNTYPEFTNPKVNPLQGIKIFRAMHQVIKSGLVSACHDLSEGGLAIALAEMCFAGRVGVEVFLDKIGLAGEKTMTDNECVRLFSESNTRFICSVRKENKQRFELMMGDLAYFKIGKTVVSDTMKMFGAHNKPIVNLRLGEIEKVWKISLSLSIE